MNSKLAKMLPLSTASSSTYGTWSSFEVESGPLGAPKSKKEGFRSWKICGSVALTFLLVIGCSLIANTKSKTETLPSTKSHIEGSADIAYGSIVDNTTAYPFVVRLHIGGFGELCTGSIISPTWVLTAGHCVWDKKNHVPYDPPTTVIYAGKITRQQKTPTAQIRNAQKFVVNPGWMNGTGSDAALIQIAGPFDMTSSVNSIPIVATRPAVGSLATAIGWGTTQTGAISNALKDATGMKVITNKQCKSHSAREICTQGGTGNTCRGDSGGPLTVGSGVNQKLAGLNSWSVTKCSDLLGNIDVFESLASYAPWIHETIQSTLELIVKPNGQGQTNDNGTYTESRSKLFGKSVWVNAAKNRMLAFNGQKWVLADLADLAKLLSNPTNAFSGIESSTNGDVALKCAIFANYAVSANFLSIILKSGGGNRGNGNGVYTRQDIFLNGFPVYLNEPKYTYLGFNQGKKQWVIGSSAYQWKSVIVGQKTSFPGWQSSIGGLTTVACETWQNYDVLI